MKQKFQRHFFFPEEINPESVTTLLTDLQEIYLPKKKTILITGCPGGDTISGLFAYNQIKLNFPNLIVIGSAEISSAATPLLLAAKPKNRFITQYTRALMHPAIFKKKKNSDKAITCSSKKFKTLEKSVQVDMKLDDAMYDAIVSKETGLSMKDVQKMNKKERTLVDNEIVKYGFASKIITNLDEFSL